MAEQDTAYRTADETALKAWREYLEGQRVINAKRLALTETLGRNAYVNRGNGFGSTRIVGFERFDSDVDGDILWHGGCLIVSSQRGAHGGRVVPNLRRKAGREFDEELRREYATPSLDLPGMATFHMYSTGHVVYVGGPSLWEWDGVLYAFWPCDDAPHEDMWEPIPLSTYYLAKEHFNTAKEDTP